MTAASRRPVESGPVSPTDGPMGTELDVVLANHKTMSEILALAVACNQTRVFNMLYSQALSTIHSKG